MDKLRRLARSLKRLTAGQPSSSSRAASRRCRRFSVWSSGISLRRRQTPPSEQDRTRPAPRRSQPLGCPRRLIRPTRRAGQCHSGRASAPFSDHQGGNPAMGAAQTREYVDKRYEDRDVNELPDAPVEALRGLGKRGGEALHKAFGVKTIRDLATNDFVLKAQEVLRLAEGPAAIPTVASTRVDATGADGSR